MNYRAKGQNRNKVSIKTKQRIFTIYSCNNKDYAFHAKHILAIMQ